MNIFYKPSPGVVGDCIPYVHDDRFHIFYLRDFRDPDSYDLAYSWHHLSTTDFVDFHDHGEALPKGNENEQDIGVATGSVFTDDDGLHHIFYTGINPYFRDDQRREQVILHATSPDLESWTKIPEHRWPADETRFERHDWRDPFVFRHPLTGRTTMLVAARTADGDPARRGCTAVLTSDDLVDWKVTDVYAPGRYHGHECPDLFRLGDWYYLLFSEYSTRTATRYLMSRSPDGPWQAPAENMFDNRAFYAAKTAALPDGPRYLFGWNPSKAGERDDGDWQWGGCLTVHEIVQDPDGTLAVRVPRSILDAFGSPEPTRPAGGTEWQPIDGGLRATAPHGRTVAVAGGLPASCLLEGELTFESTDGEAGVLLNTDDTGAGGYFLRFSPARQAIQFGRIGGYRPWHIDHLAELDRPLAIRAGRPLHYRLVVDGTAVVAYLDDRVALSARMYGRPRGHQAIYADGVTARFTGQTVRPWPRRNR